VIPLRDAIPTRRTPVVTILLIVANVVAFAYRLGVESSEGEPGIEELFFTYGLVPAELLADWGAGRQLGGEALAVFTSMFLHVNLIHIGGNMLYLWIFGNNIEDRLGRAWFIAFYFLGGVAAAAAQVAIDPASEVPMVGASGAVSAVLGAYLVLFPGAKVLSLVFLGFFYQLINVPAIIVLGLWFVLQLIDGIGSLGLAGAEGGVAFFAHIGGFVAGVAMGLLARAVFRRGGGPLTRSLDRAGVG
jgi:membrane associated rhomboid family serine protease